MQRSEHVATIGSRITRQHLEGKVGGVEEVTNRNLREERIFSTCTGG